MSTNFFQSANFKQKCPEPHFNYIQPKTFGKGYVLNKQAIYIYQKRRVKARQLRIMEFDKTGSNFRGDCLYLHRTNIQRKGMNPSSLSSVSLYYVRAKKKLQLPEGQYRF